MADDKKAMHEELNKLGAEYKAAYKEFLKKRGKRKVRGVGIDPAEYEFEKEWHEKILAILKKYQS